jgi:signal transduction histidine kinase
MKAMKAKRQCGQRPSEPRQQLSAIYQVIATTNRATSLNAVVKELVKKLNGIFQFDGTRIFLLDTQKDVFRLHASCETMLGFLDLTVFKRGQGIIGRVTQTGKPAVFDNVRSDILYQRDGATNTALKIGNRFLAIVPIMSHRRAFGTIVCIGKDRRTLQSSERQLLMSICNQIGIVVERLQLFEKSRTQEIDLKRELIERQKAEKKVVDDQKQLRRLGLELLLAEERERRRVAAGLHDEIGPGLALASIELQELQALECSGDEVRRRLGDIRERIDHTITTIRSLNFELSSPVLYTLGLAAALQNLGEWFQKRNGFQFHFRATRQLKQLPNGSTVLLYRIVRELLRNIEKHAHAHTVTLSMARARDQIQITVEDDGVGFDPSRAGQCFTPTGGYGLFSITEQIGHIGGRLKVKSSMGKGCRVVVAAPLE